MLAFQKATAIQDSFNVWFVIPDNMVDEFRKHRSDHEFVRSGEFGKKYHKYMLGWTNHEHNDHVQLYIETEEENVEVTDRELALRWWNIKTIQEKTELAKQAKLQIDNRNPNTLTGNEIEWIWRNRFLWNRIIQNRKQL